MKPARDQRSDILRVAAESGKILTELETVSLAGFDGIVEHAVGVAVSERRSGLAARRLLNHRRCARERRHLCHAYRVAQTDRAEFRGGKSEPQPEGGGVALIVD